MVKHDKPSVKRVPLALLLSVLLISAALPARAQITGVSVPELSHFDERVPAFLSEHNMPGAAVAVAKGGRLVYSRGFGLADVEAETSVEPDSRFRIASLSKPLTATAVMKLVEDGLLDLDEPAFAHLDDLPLLDDQTEDPRLSDITIRHLLQHAGGWDRVTSGFDPAWWSSQVGWEVDRNPPASPETLVRYMRGRTLDFDPGTRFVYSNFGYLVLGRIIERVSGRSYEDFVTDLLAPTGASRFALGGTYLADRLEGEVRYYYPGNATAQNVAPPYNQVPWPYGGYSMTAYEAAGGWVGTAPDLIRFLEAIDGRTGRPDILSPETIEMMTARPAMAHWDNSAWWYALGLFVGGVGWWHDGDLPGHRSFLVRMSQTDVSFVILLNASPENDNTFYPALQNLMLRAVADVEEWPLHDLFESTTTAELGPALPQGITLSAPYPNPTSATATVSLSASSADELSIGVYDLLGRRVLQIHDLGRSTGPRQFMLDTSSLPSGVYVVRATAGELSATRQLVVIK
jgi:CubicO group peptidase (beta-lactamase class C family)